ILRPDGKYDIFNIFGFGATSPGTFWKVGLLDQGGRGCSSTSLSSCLETETRTWDQRSGSPVSSSKYSAPGYAVCAGSTAPVDAAVYAPALATRTRKRDGATYTTTFSTWDAYGQPQTVTESGQQSRTTTMTYFYATTNSLGTLNLVRDRLLTAHS